MTGKPPHVFVPLGVLFSLVWSSAFIAGAVAVPELGPFPTLVLRFVLSGWHFCPGACGSHGFWIPVLCRRACCSGR